MPSSPDGIRSNTVVPTEARSGINAFPTPSVATNGTVSSVGGSRSSAIVAGANSRRIRAFLKNDAAVGHLHVKLGPGCTTTNYHLILSVAAVAGNGTGGEHKFENYSGEISVASAGTVAYSFYEINQA
jgi:hypothetical protein